MADVITTGIENVKNLYLNSVFFGLEWALGVIIIFITCILITRNPHTWKKLGLPITAIYGVMGFMISPLIYTLAGFIFVFGLFNTREIGNLVTAGNKTLTIRNLMDEESRITYDTNKKLNISGFIENAKDNNIGYQTRKNKKRTELNKRRKEERKEFYDDKLKNEKEIALFKSQIAQKTAGKTGRAYEIGRHRAKKEINKKMIDNTNMFKEVWINSPPSVELIEYQKNKKKRKS